MLLADIIQLWNAAAPAGVTMLVLGTAFAIILLIASEKLKVTVDPKIEQIQLALPNVDCGVCGFAGCSSYAKAVAADAKRIGKRAPGGAEVAGEIAGVLNLQISGDSAPLRPVVHCRAHTSDRTCYGKYEGIPSCTAANAVAVVQACKFGCLGFGDCVAACKFDALHIADGLAVVDYEKCTGCSACAKACPRDLIEMVSFTSENMMTVACHNLENGKTTRSMCKVGCIACKMCTKQNEAFTMDGNFARLDYNKYKPGESFETAATKCPTGVIVYRGKNARPDRQPAKK